MIFLHYFSRFVFVCKRVIPARNIISDAFVMIFGLFDC